jgi:hypothetical protein
MRIRHFMLAGALIASVGPLSAAPPRVTLLAPRADERVAGGRETTLAWSAPNLPERAEEWEAFLSLDDGAHYPIRLTPHLDTHIRTFRWRVPNVAASRARLLLRFGDESHEEIVEPAQTFTIVPDYASLDLTSPRIATSKELGEAAIAGVAPSVEWVSGDRAGGNLVTHRHHDAFASSTSSLDQQTPSDTVVVSRDQTPLRDEPRPILSDLTTPRRWPRADIRGTARPLLLLSTRLNV